MKASRMDVAGIVKDESRGSSSLAIGRLSRVLVVGEIAMSLALLVAVVNESFARKFFPGESALAHRFRAGASGSTAPWLTVVGWFPTCGCRG